MVPSGAYILHVVWVIGCSAAENSGRSPARSSPSAATYWSLWGYPDAKCLDGSTAGYYFRKGLANRYLMFLEGGGWCYDSRCERPTAEGTLNDCWRRSRTNLGSSRWWPEVEDSYLSGMLSADPLSNPVFYDWTLVYVRYCDGASFTGDAIVDGLHFRGSRILEAIVADLLRTTAIRQAEKVVLSGGSAGASAVYYHLDTVAQQLALESGEVVGLPDAGFFLDLRDKDGIDCWPAQMRSLFDAINGYAGLHRGCLARFPQETWKCLFPEYYADLIDARVFAINSLYDSSETWATLRLDCCPTPGSCYRGQMLCSGYEQHLFESLREQHIRAWAPLAAGGRRGGSGVWAPACVAHTMTWKSWSDPAWEVPAGSGNTQAAAVQAWLRGDAGGSGAFLFQDNVSWPSNRPCVGGRGIKWWEETAGNYSSPGFTELM